MFGNRTVSIVPEVFWPNCLKYRIFKSKGFLSIQISTCSVKQLLLSTKSLERKSCKSRSYAVPSWLKKMLHAYHFLLDSIMTIKFSFWFKKGIYINGFWHWSALWTEIGTAGVCLSFDCSSLLINWISQGKWQWNNPWMNCINEHW